MTKKREHVDESDDATVHPWTQEARRVLGDPELADANLARFVTLVEREAERQRRSQS